jgi:REP element-mobilizing transposase RayT
MQYRRQTAFFTAVNTHGGTLATGKRKVARPIATKRPMHLVLKSSNACGPRSLHSKSRWLEALLRKLSSQCGVRVFRYSNNGNHLHLVVQARTRKGFQTFLMAFSGTVAQKMTGSRKGNPQSKRFWDAIPFTRILEWGKDFKNAIAYTEQNYLEARGLIPYRPRPAASITRPPPP